MRIVPPLLDNVNSIGIAYPPINSMVVAGEQFGQRRSPATAA